MSTNRGERGPKGDHGQHGDEGLTGGIGLTGAPGAPGSPGTPGAAGAEGREGKQGRPGPPGEKGDQGESGKIDRLNSFRSSKTGVLLFYGYLVAILLSSFMVGRVVLENSRISKESHRGLCTLKAERIARVDATLKIIAHPEKPENAKIIATFGMPLLTRSLVTARADASALKDVSC